MSTRQKAASKRASKCVSVPKSMRHPCSKFGVTHPAPTGKKCAQVFNRELFAAVSTVDANTEVGNKTSTPRNASFVSTIGTVNTYNIITAGGSIVTCNEVADVANVAI